MTWRAASHEYLVCVECETLTSTPDAPENIFEVGVGLFEEDLLASLIDATVMVNLGYFDIPLIQVAADRPKCERESNTRGNEPKS